MRRLLVALATTISVAAGLLAPVASARVHITLRYTAVFDLKTVRVNVEPLRDTDVLDEKSAQVNLEPGAISALLYVPRGIAGSVRFSARNGRGDSVVFGARLRFREGTVSARAVIGRHTRNVRIRVTGGTRRFRGTRGDLRFVSAGGRGDRIGLVLRLR